MVKVKITLQQATKAQWGSRCIALLFLQPRRQMGWVIRATLRPLYPRERPGTHCTGGWVGPPVWTSAENLAPTGIRSPDRPTRSESLYRLSYAGPLIHSKQCIKSCGLNEVVQVTTRELDPNGLLWFRVDFEMKVYLLTHSMVQSPS